MNQANNEKWAQIKDQPYLLVNGQPVKNIKTPDGNIRIDLDGKEIILTETGMRFEPGQRPFWKTGDCDYTVEPLLEVQNLWGVITSQSDGIRNQFLVNTSENLLHLEQNEPEKLYDLLKDAIEDIGEDDEFYCFRLNDISPVRV